MKTFVVLAIVLGCSCAVLSQNDAASLCGEVRDTYYLKSVQGSRCKKFVFCDKDGQHPFEMMCGEGTWFDDESMDCILTSEDQCPDQSPRDPEDAGGRPYHVMENNCTMWVQSTINRQYVQSCDRDHLLCFSNSAGVCVDCNDMTDEDKEACGFNLPAYQK